MGDTAKSRIFAYRISNQSRRTSAEFATLGDPNYESMAPRGLWSDGTTIRQAETVGHKTFAYSLRNKSRDPQKGFNTLGPAGNENIEGIGSDGEVMWVMDLQDYQLYAYGLDSKQRLLHLDFNTLAARTTITWATSGPTARPCGCWTTTTGKSTPTTCYPLSDRKDRRRSRNS